MFEARNLKLDLVALALLALVVFLSCALLTYDPADPVVELVYPLNQLYQSDSLVYPANPQTVNASGCWGALAADVLLNALGIGAFYLVLSLGVVTVRLLMRREITSPLLRAVGWASSLVGLTTLVTICCPSLSPGPVIGAGGYLGALGRGILELHFATFGALIFTLSLIVGGLLLCTDYALIHLALIVAALFVDRVARRKKTRVRRKTKPTADEEDDEETVKKEGLSVRIRGKRIATSADDLADGEIEADGEEEEYEEEEEAPDEEEEEETEEESEEEEPPTTVVRSGKRRRLIPSLRLRKPPEETEEREEVMQQLDEAAHAEESEEYELPTMDLLLEQDDFSFEEQAKEVRRKARILEKTFANFGFKVKVVEIETGPVIAQYEVELEAGLRLSRITGLADDLAIALRVPSVRIVAPIPGKNTVGIEVPNEERQVVRLREVMEETDGRLKKMHIPLFLGKDVSGNPLTVDLSTLPHLLIAGRTGTGKSVCLNAIISSILMTRRPDEVRMLMIDPKMVELSGYKTLPHLMHPVVTDMRKAEAILAWAVDKMEERYELLARAGVRHVSVYNQLGEEELMERLQPEDDEQRKSIPLHMPYVVIVADEIADLMMTSGKEVEQHIIRLAQKSRAVGIHLILATQKPTVDVITGLIKSNLPARIAFQVASRTDSRVVLDEMGADKLLGNGDLLFLWPGTSTLMRGQGTYLSDDEINGVVEAASRGEQNFVKELVQLKVSDGEEAGPGALKKRDDLYEGAVDVVVREGRGSVSLLQRALGVGYGRAARLIDYMAEDGLVGAYAGSQAREVLISVEDWRRMQGAEDDSDEESAKPRRSNKVKPAPEEATRETGDASAGSVAGVITHNQDRDPVQVQPYRDTDDVDAYDDEKEDDAANSAIADDTEDAYEQYEEDEAEEAEEDVEYVYEDDEEEDETEADEDPETNEDEDDEEDDEEEYEEEGYDEEAYEDEDEPYEDDELADEPLEAESA